MFFLTSMVNIPFAQAHNKLREVLDTMVKRGCVDMSPSVQASLASRQYISTVSEAADGMYIISTFHVSTCCALLTLGAARVTILGLCVCVSVYDYSHATGNKAVSE